MGYLSARAGEARKWEQVEDEDENEDEDDLNGLTQGAPRAGWANVGIQSHD